MEGKKTGVLLINFGAPKKLEEVASFVTHIFNGRKLPEHVLKMTQEKYSLIGGGSPLYAITSAQALRLEEELKKRGRSIPVYIGMLHSKPFISQSVEKMVQEGINKIIALSLAPFYSRVSSGAYYAQVEQMKEKIPSHVSITYGREWYHHPLFIQAWVEKISQALRDDGYGEEVNLIFTTHSLPLNPMEDALVYKRQFQETVKAVGERFPWNKVYPAYQSKGKRPGNWLAPPVEEVIKKLAAQGEKKVLIIPVGFVSDHLETLYDLDIELKKLAEKEGIDFRRIPALNNDSGFIKLLGELVLANIDISCAE